MQRETLLLKRSNNPFTIRIPGYGHVFDTRLIIQFEGNGNYTIVHLKNNLKPLLVSQTLKRFEGQLPSFIRISKSILVNPDYVEQVIEESSKLVCLKLVTGKCVMIARRRLAYTLARLENILSELP